MDYKVSDSINMKELIKRLLLEAIKHLPYDDKPEMKQHSYSSLSNPNRKSNLNTIKFRLAKAAQTVQDFRDKNPNDHYFSSAISGDGFYQVEFKHDGQIRTKHIKASGDMEQHSGPFQPTDVGTCRDYQNIAKYCFVKAGRHRSSVGASPAEDAANKALILFRTEILDFYSENSYVDDKAADISKEKMTDKQALHKQKKDLETKIGRRLSDSEWNHYQETGVEPKTKATLTLDPQKAAELQKRQDAIQDKIANLKARRKI